MLDGRRSQRAAAELRLRYLEAVNISATIGKSNFTSA
jgi:hypothetical protein